MINENLKKLRISRKYTQEEVAEKLGVSRQSIAKWESGETLPDINKCVELANLYGLLVDDLVAAITDTAGKEIRRNRAEEEGKYIFGMVKVGERGQIVIPKKARDVFQIQAGDSLLILGDIREGMAMVKVDDMEASFGDLQIGLILKGESYEGN